MSRVNVALVQFQPELADLAANLEKVRRCLQAAGSAHLVVLPELASSGYAFRSREEAHACSEDLGASRYVDLLQEHAARHGSHVVSGVNERAGDRQFNSAVVVGRSGIVGVYRKLHLFDTEKIHFQPGDGGCAVFDLGAFRLGVAICFDWAFPEVWRVMALRGADIVAHPSNLIIPGNCQRAVPVHAMINRLFILTANRVGVEGGLRFTGCSTINDARGRCLATANETEETVLRATLDLELARDKRITLRNDLLADRRPEAYSEIVAGS